MITSGDLNGCRLTWRCREVQNFSPHVSSWFYQKKAEMSFRGNDAYFLTIFVSVQFFW